MPFPLMGEVKGRFRCYLGTAKLTWGQWTSDERLKTEGRADRLAGRNQEMDAIARDESEKRPRLPKKRRNARQEA